VSDNSPQSGIYTDPDYRPGLDPQAQDDLTDWGDFVSAGSERSHARDAHAWEIGQILVIAVERFGIEVSRGRPKKDRVRILESPATILRDVVGKTGTITGASKEGFMVLVDGDQTPVSLTKEEIGPPVLLGSLGQEMGLSSQKTSKLYLNASFYPRREWRLDLPFDHYTAARQAANDDLDSALELLEHARTLKLTAIEAFRKYCAGEYYNDLWPEEVEMPEGIRRLAPNGEGVEFRLIVKRKQEK
jgi:hypothetical protein